MIRQQDGVGIGAAVARLEDSSLVQGNGTYTADVGGQGTATCAFVRSPIAHGWIRDLDLSAVREAPGVLAAFGAEDLGLRPFPAVTLASTAPVNSEMVRPPLAAGRVRYAGEPLAVIVATDPYVAADALELIDVDFDELEAVDSIDKAMSGDVLLFDAAGTNVAADLDVRAGNATSGVGEWPVSIALDVAHPRLAPVPIEPLGIVARPEPDGAFTVWCGHQAPHRLRRWLAHAMDLDESLIRVIVPDVGGSFGHKVAMYPEFPVVLACAQRVGRPVRWIETRTENLVGGTHGRGQMHHIELAGDEDGRIRSLRMRIVGDLGAYPHNGAISSQTTARMSAGPYDIEHVDITCTAVVTNRAPIGPYRGAGRPESTLSLERAVDTYAHAVGLEPAHVRALNFVAPARMPYTNASGLRYDSGDYNQALQEVLARFDLEDFRLRQRGRQAQDLDPIGFGLGAFLERAGGAGDSSEFARVEFDDSGKVLVAVGSASTGQGHHTTWAQIAADTLGLRSLDHVQVVSGDTRVIQSGTGSFGSRSVQVGGSAVLRCSRQVRGRLLEVASAMLEVAPDDLVLEGGRVAVRGDATAAVTFGEVVGAARRDNVDLAHEESYTPGAPTFPYGVYAALVEVDRDTGRIKVERMLAVDDCGSVINPIIVEGQVVGSTVQGISQALFEEFVYGEAGQPVTSTLVDYTIPSANDVPEISTGRIRVPSPLNPLGAKGTGEAGCIGAPAAIVNATVDALRPWDVTDLQIPLTPQRVWRAMQRMPDPDGPSL